jgi:RNA polymerase sigma-70 factor (ECF subfamily)
VVADPSEAEDVTQEAFLRLYTELEENGGIGNPRAWVLRAAHNLAIDHCRARRNLARFDEGDQVDPAAHDNVEAVMIDQERHENFRSFLSDLSPQERRCMELRAGGFRYREISGILGIQISSVQTNLTRAVKKLMEKMNA